MANGEITKLAKFSKKLIDVLGDNGASLINYTSTLAGAIKRTILSKLTDDVTVKDFGAVGDGINDDRAAINQMATQLGYVIFPAGNFRIPGNHTIAVPSFYREGAYLTVDAGVTVWVNNRVNSPNQWIFRGTGRVLFTLTTTGEDAQFVRVGWFGAFPYNGVTSESDVTARIQRALSSLSTQTREGTLQFEIGSYHVTSTLYVPRGVEVIAGGMRRTIFDISGPGDWTVFETAGNACKFKDFQFEYPTGEGKVRTAPYIHVKHNTCDIENIWVYPSTIGVLVDGPQCQIKCLRATFGLDPQSVDTESSLVWVRTGSVTIRDVQVLGTTYTPKYLVRVGHTSTISNVAVHDIQTSCAAVGVFFDARAGAITRCSVDGLLASPSGQPADYYEALVKIRAAGAFIANYLSISGLIGNSIAASAIDVEATDTSIVSNLVVGDVSLQSSTTGYGIRLRHYGTGQIRDLYFAEDVDIAGRNTPIERIGTVLRVNDSHAMRGATYVGSMSRVVSIPPNTAVEISDYKPAIFAGRLEIGSSAVNVWGNYSIRAAGSSDHITQMNGHADMAVSNGDLTGTTGAVGKFTVGVRGPGRLVLENRLAANVTVCVTLTGG